MLYPMSDDFSISRIDLLRLIKFYKRAPKQFMMASKGLLTSFAYQSREQQIREIQSSMTVRNINFVKARIRYQKARGNRIDNIYAETGSIQSPRFTGWKEQELGTKPMRTRTQSLTARGSDWNKQVKGTARMKPANRFFDPDSEMEGSSTEQRMAIALAGMRKGTIKKRNFLIKKKMRGKLKTLKRGLWGMQRKQIYRLQTFKPSKLQPKRNQWHSRAIRKTMARINLRNEWVKQINRVLDYGK